MIGNGDYEKKVSELFENAEKDPDVQIWNDIYKDAVLGLIEEGIPLNKNYYLSKDIHESLQEKNIRNDSIPPYAMRNMPGIILEKIWYQNEAGHIIPKWITELGDEGSFFVYRCRWILQPLNIRDLPESKKQIFRYKMEVWKYDVYSTQSVRFAGVIETGIDGKVLNKEILVGKDDKFSYRIPFPHKIVSQINRYLANNFLRELWIGSCAAWYCTDKGIAYYLGDFLKNSNKVETSGKSLWQECVKLVNGPNGEVAFVSASDKM